MKIEIKNPVEKLKAKKSAEKSEVKESAEKREIRSPAESKSATKKIWFVESAVAIAASALALIIASVY
ncbi:MAG: hypothetical protein Q4A83_09330 [Bacillota bacterium]|nr:hypothetical protein [Bacillota bacterium]